MVQYTYEPFGRTSSTNPTFPNPFQYTSREHDTPTGLYFYRARYYKPVLHRFLNEDPIHLLGGDINLYAYAWNRPTNFIDPSGLWGVGALFGGTAAGGLGPAGVSAAATGSVGGGVFGGGSQGLNVGGFASFGAFAGGPRFGPSVPSDNASNFALGGFVGVSPGAFITNATNVQQLVGPFNTTSLDVGIGAIRVSLQFSFSGGTWIFSLSGGPPGSIGLAISNLVTNTWTRPRAK